MARSGDAAGRSGDPRKRAAQAQPPPGGALRLRAVFATGVVAAAAVGATLLIALGHEGEPVDDASRRHGVAACDLTAKAADAASVDTDARYAAAALLMDQAILESGRAARAASEFTELDRAMRAVHAAAHRGESASWREAIDAALADCRKQFG